jgi:hypothetical protein
MPNLQFTPNLTNLIKKSLTAFSENHNRIHIEAQFGYVPIEPGVMYRLKLIILSSDGDNLVLKIEASNLVYKGLYCNRPPIQIRCCDIKQNDNLEEILRMSNEALKKIYICKMCFMPDILYSPDQTSDMCNECATYNSMLRFEIDDACSICQEEMTSLVTTLECGHLFHKRCINTYILTKAREVEEVPCPICRQEINHVYSKLYMPY